MSEKIFVDVNVIQTVPPSCVNRDDTGSPKTAVYGGIPRARVSSQSWKKAMRDFFREDFDESELGYRTKKVVDLIAARIAEKDGSVSAEDATKKAADVLTAAGVKLKAPKKKKGEEEKPATETEALFFISTKQIDNMASLALEGGYDKKAAQAALMAGQGIEVALFGRMVADDPSLNVDASSQVAHGISTHRVDNEYDYYTAVDDMAPEDNAGAGMIGTVEFNSSTLYRYATVAAHDLAEHLGSSEAAAKAAAEFVKAFVLSMPSGKQNTFANRTAPYAVFVAVRSDQPVSLVTAFESPAKCGDGGYNEDSVRKLVDEEKKVCSDFVAPPVKSWQIGEGLGDLGPQSTLADTLAQLEDYLKGALGKEE